MLDVSLFRQPAFLGVQLATFCIGAGMFALFPYLSIYLQDIDGNSPLGAGLRFLPITAFVFFVPLADAQGRARASRCGCCSSASLALVALGLLLMEAGVDGIALDGPAARASSSAASGSGSPTRRSPARRCASSTRRAAAWRRGSATRAASAGSRSASPAFGVAAAAPRRRPPGRRRLPRQGDRRRRQLVGPARGSGPAGAASRRERRVRAAASG